MRSFIPDTRNLTGIAPGYRTTANRPDHGGDSSRVPSDMDSDPNADEEVIDQSSREQYPVPVRDDAESAKITPDNLADSIAYALDGSGPGPINDTPNVSGHKVITEGTTGAGLDGKEDTMRT